MTKAVLSIDYTRDFVASNGRLTAGKPAQAISETIAAVSQKAWEAGAYVFFMIDEHLEGDLYHPETQLFPPHNIRGTEGRYLYGPSKEFFEEHQESNRVYWMDKHYYSAFAGTMLDIYLRERKVDTLVLTGVLTDICVLHTAIDAYQKGYKIEVVTDAVASITEAQHQFALEHMKDVLGAKLISSEELEF
ncbi:cysteine hydrolase family protein [Streptococcus sp. 10F2]